MNDLSIATPEMILQGLEEAIRKGPPKVAPEDRPEMIRRWEEVLERIGGHREVFRNRVGCKRNLREDGSLMTYREIAEDFGNRRSPMTYCRWMWKDFPKVAQAMAEARDAQ